MQWPQERGHGVHLWNLFNTTDLEVTLSDSPLFTVPSPFYHNLSFLKVKFCSGNVDSYNTHFDSSTKLVLFREVSFQNQQWHFNIISLLQCSKMAFRHYLTKLTLQETDKDKSASSVWHCGVQAEVEAGSLLLMYHLTWEGHLNFPMLMLLTWKVWRLNQAIAQKFPVLWIYEILN